jgi:hypothetical protein
MNDFKILYFHLWTILLSIKKYGQENLVDIFVNPLNADLYKLYAQSVIINFSTAIILFSSVILIK